MSPIRLRVRELREGRGLTLAQLADAARVRIATLSDIETGKTRGLRFDTLERIADALGVNAAVLLEHAPAGTGASLRRGKGAKRARD